MYLLVEVFEFAARIAEEELAFDPDGETENVGEKQRAVCSNRLQVRVRMRLRQGMRKCIWLIIPKPRARKISVATKTALAIMRLPFRHAVCAACYRTNAERIFSSPQN